MKKIVSIIMVLSSLAFASAASESLHITFDSSNTYGSGPSHKFVYAPAGCDLMTIAVSDDGWVGGIGIAISLPGGGQLRSDIMGSHPYYSSIYDADYLYNQPAGEYVLYGGGTYIPASSSMDAYVTAVITW
ncbi:hypothetical protein [Pelagicoccus sp. SDUM812002]|uniref:hypothetical protein n=1 Tax=Pelagicoccus sp. SDUM812002 TaxID=3041266 RepID=UPI00280F5D41|nr:hypothetical protein [Pelagicoccus sp. SDUM812002]MDQ8188490.1 hypothetical protein [Pelagicoccus sp. SDUM812002]